MTEAQPAEAENRYQVVVYDLDSTVCDTRHRHEFADKVKAGEATWEEYSLQCVDDKPYPGAIKLMQITDRLYRNYILTGRDIVAWDHTVKWLKQEKAPWHMMRMRTPEDPYPSVEYKVKAMLELRDHGADVVLVIEDWPPIVDALEAEGFTVLCVNPRYEEDNPESDKPSFGV